MDRIEIDHRIRCLGRADVVDYIEHYLKSFYNEIEDAQKNEDGFYDTFCIQYAALNALYRHIIERYFPEQA